MTSTEELTLVCLIKVAPEKLTAGMTVSRLPDAIDDAVVALSPGGVSPSNYYLVTGDYGDLASYVNEVAVPFHEYATEALGDRCEVSGCLEHRGLAPVVQLFRKYGGAP